MGGLPVPQELDADPVPNDRRAGLGAPRTHVSPIARRGLPALTALLALVAASPPAFGESPASPVPAPPEAPVLQEFRYRLSGAVRPLLFWLGDSDVGAARIVLRADENRRRGYELLIGSDPGRAPRGINRWGWVWEERREDGATQRGLMRKVDEQSVEEARAKVGFESEYVFKAIRTEIAEGRARAENTVWLVEDNYTYYDLETVRHLIEATPQSSPQVNEGPMPPDTHPGLLFAIADLIDRAVEAATEDPRELLQDVTTNYNFNAIVCDLSLRRTEWEGSKQYGDRRYDGLIRMEFKSYNPEDHGTDHFTLVCGTEGEWRGVPVYMKYQPKWWFRTEGVIDESQVFERPQALQAGSTSPEGANRGG